MNRKSFDRLRDDLFARYEGARLRGPKHWGWMQLRHELALASLSELSVPKSDFTIPVAGYGEYLGAAGCTDRYLGY